MAYKKVGSLRTILYPKLLFKIISGYFVVFHCFIHVQTNTVTTESTKDITHTDQCCSAEVTSMSMLNINRTSTSFTEEFISKREGKHVDVKKLLTVYSSVCPLQETCGVNIDERFLFHDEIFPDITGCNGCSCERSCVNNGNCCPGIHYGYVDYTCINSNLYPKTTEVSYHMVDTCLDNYDNKTVINMCGGKVEPCTGIKSGLIYKNKYCAECNEELQCKLWEIEVECAIAEDFEKKMASFSSLVDMKKALDENDCRVGYRLSNHEHAFKCSHFHDESKIRIDKCNVSGFWETYDKDIEWACLNFNAPYRNFKNIFCYICNPSHASMQSVPIIDSCTSASSDIESKINEACESFPLSSRLVPFKNVYCYVCSQGYKTLFVGSKYSFQYVEEDNTIDLQTRLDIAITFFGEQRVKDFKTLVDNLLNLPADDFEESEQDTAPYMSIKLNYDDSSVNKIVKDYIAVCGTKTLCHVRNSTEKIYGNPVCKTCTCDSICAENESCCPDILFTKEPYSCLSPEKFSSFNKNRSEKLKSVHNFSSDYLKTDLFKTIDTCLNDDVSVSVKEKCSLHNNASFNLSRIPISTDADLTYRNIYCYECNNNKSDITLKIQAYCKTYIEHKLYTNVEGLLNGIKHYCDEISFVPIRNKVCQQTYDSKKASLILGEKFIRRELHPSEFEFKVKKYEQINANSHQQFVRNVFDECNKTGMYLNVKSDLIPLVKNVCETNDVNGMSLSEYRVDSNVYKNFACFLCNPDTEISMVDFDTIISHCLSNHSEPWYEPSDVLEELCNETELYPRWYPYKNMYCAECNLPPWQQIEVLISTKDELPAAGYKYIFTLSAADFEHLDEVMEKEDIPDCPQGTYDYFSKKCRQLSCNGGFQLFKTTCRPVLESAVRHEYSLSIDVHYLSRDELNISGINDTNTTIIVNVDTVCTRIVENITSLFGETTVYFIKLKECTIFHCIYFGASNHYFDIVQMDTLSLKLSVLIMETKTISKVHTALLNALHGQFDISDIQDINGMQKSFLLESRPQGKNDREDQNDLRHPCFHSLFYMDSKIGLLQYNRYTVDPFLTCGYVKLNISDVCLNLGSENISLKNRDAEFLVWEYKIVGQNVIICADIYNMRTFTEPVAVLHIRTEPIKSTFIFFSLVCTIVSLLCLLLTFTTYCLISSLRTTAGKNVMALCFSLFFSQAFLQFGINATDVTTLCVAIGIFIHLFWLVTFCAMNVCSFDTMNVFYYSNAINRPINNKSRNRLFLKYSIYMICLPVIFVLVAISASLIKTNFSDIGYGKFYCFISDFYIFIFTFVTPACLIFVSNIVFFSVAFHKIRSSPNVRSTTQRNNFYICLRLCTIVGIAWPLLIIDSSLQSITWLSFICAGVNSLQGVFIFVSFVINRRVVAILVSKLRARIGERSGSRGTTSSKCSDCQRNYRPTTN